MGILTFINTYINIYYINHYLIKHILFMTSFIYIHCNNWISILISYEFLGLVSSLLVYNMGNVSCSVYIYGRLADIFIMLAITMGCACYIILAIVIKSAIFPFGNWLYISMFAQLPTSSMLHSSLLVLIGILVCGYIGIDDGIWYLSLSSILYGAIRCMSSIDSKCMIASSTIINISLALYLLIHNYICSGNIIIYHALLKSAIFLHLCYLNNRIWIYYYKITLIYIIMDFNILNIDNSRWVNIIIKYDILGIYSSEL